MFNKYDKYINMIQNEEIKTITTKALIANESINDKKCKDAIEVTKWVLFLLKNDKLIADNNYALFVDVLISAGLLHNLNYEYGETDFYYIFKTRKILEKLNTEVGLPTTYLDSICQTVECQLGKDNTISLLIPNPNSPGAHFSLACSIYYKTKNTIQD